MARKPDPKSKAGFVRSLPSSTPAAEVVSKAKAKGIKLDVRYVYSVRTASRGTAKEQAAGAAAPKRGRGRPKKVTMAAVVPEPKPARVRENGAGRASGNGSRAPAVRGATGIEAAIERIVERVVEAKFREFLRSPVGALR